MRTSRRHFLKSSGLSTGAICLSGNSSIAAREPASHPITASFQNESLADYVIHIQSTALEIAPKRIISAVTYNGQFPGPLLRFKEGQAATVDIFNDTDTPEQLHWHGQRVGVD